MFIRREIPVLGCIQGVHKSSCGQNQNTFQSVQEDASSYTRGSVSKDSKGMKQLNMATVAQSYSSSGR